MHKYQPRIHIVKTRDETQLREFQQANSESFSTHIFEETQFMGVTAYQNQQVCVCVCVCVCSAAIVSDFRTVRTFIAKNTSRISQ